MYSLEFAPVTFHSEEYWLKALYMVFSSMPTSLFVLMVYTQRNDQYRQIHV